MQTQALRMSPLGQSNASFLKVLLRQPSYSAAVIALQKDNQSMGEGKKNNNNTHSVDSAAPGSIDLIYWWRGQSRVEHEAAFPGTVCAEEIKFYPAKTSCHSMTRSSLSRPI